MKNSIILFATTLLLITGCKNKEQNEKVTNEPTQMQRVMKIHDEVMPKMGTIGKLITRLENKPDSIKTTSEYQTAINDLKEAHDYMMTWMIDFGKRFDYEESMKGKALSDQKKIWLNEEEEKVKVMRDKVVNSIKNAELLLDNETE